MLSVLNQLVETVTEDPEDAPPEARRLAEMSIAILRRVHNQPLRSAGATGEKTALAPSAGKPAIEAG